MNKKEACRRIDNLDYYLQHYTPPDYSERDHEAMMMAKRTLEQETCEDCVSRRSVDLLTCRYLKDPSDNHVSFYEDFLNLPSVTPIRPKGHWIKTELPSRDAHECSECGNLALIDEWGNEKLTDFCPNCGIKMESEK